MVINKFSLIPWTS